MSVMEQQMQDQIEGALHEQEQTQALDLHIVVHGVLEQKEAAYKIAIEWFETEYDSNSTDEEVAEQNKVCYSLSEQIKLLKFLLSNK